MLAAAAVASVVCVLCVPLLYCCCRRCRKRRDGKDEERPINSDEGDSDDANELANFTPTIGDEAKAWFWALNGACGVFAGVCSLALAMAFGFEAVAWMGVGGYVIAGLLFLRARG